MIIKSSNHQIIKSSILIFGIISTFSCENENQNTERVKKALIFNDFNVDQPRGHMAAVQYESTTVDQHRDGASAGLQSRSSGIVRTLVCEGLQNADKTQFKLGSGFLSSSTRFTTSMHIVNGEAYSPGSPKPIIIRFGQSGLPTLDINDYVADSGVDHGALQYNEDYRYEVEEEPYLPMRLFQLGLNAWAWKDASSKSPQWRRELRRWEFKVAPGKATDGSFYNQGFAKLIDTNVQGEDIAVLEVVGLAEKECPQEPQTPPCESPIEEIWDDVQAGKFPLNRPGVFFDHMKPVLYQGLTNDKKLWMEHSNEWPIDSDVHARLISRPGFPISGARTTLNPPNECNGEEHNFTGLVGHTLDSKSGSSGGAILSSYYELHADGYELPESKLAVFGLHSASIWDPNLSPESWLTIGPVSATEPSPLWDGNNANFFTGISNPTLLREDPDPPVTSPGDPAPCDPGETSNCILCEDYNGNGECIDFTKTEPEIIADDGSIIGPVIPIPISEDDDSSRQERYGTRNVNCIFNAANEPYSHWDWAFKKAKFPGMVVGIMGASVGPFNNEDGVGDLMAICAPLSSRSYTENWHFLDARGSVLPHNLTNLRGRRDWGPLNTMLTDSYTINDDNPEKGHEIRPVPMKFCPPNYIMTGVNVRMNEFGIAGIFELLCKPSVNPNAPDIGEQGQNELIVGFSASSEAVDGYTMFGVEYSLDQRIGNPTPSESRDDVVEQSCDGFVSGLKMVHDKNGLLRHFQTVCTPYNL